MSNFVYAPSTRCGWRGGRGLCTCGRRLMVASRAFDLARPDKFSTYCMCATETLKRYALAGGVGGIQTEGSSIIPANRPSYMRSTSNVQPSSLIGVDETRVAAQI